MSMENPATWKRAEAMIAKRLREAGLLKDQDEPELGWEGLRAMRARPADVPGHEADVAGPGGPGDPEAG
jgi:hypothetical protein